jgi:hypothetical protein
LLKQLVALDREQGREIDSLDQENNTLEKQLAQIQATNNRLQLTIGQMSGAKRSIKSQTTAPTLPANPSVSAPTAEVDVATLKKVQDLESQLLQLQAQPSTAQNQEKISNLNTRLSALQAQVGELSPAKSGGVTSPFTGLDSPDQKSTAKKSAPRPRAPAADLDIKPKKFAKAKTTKAKSKTSKTTAQDDQVDYLDIEDVTEHGGGIGPRQHWQSLMKNEGWSDRYVSQRTGQPRTPYAVYIDGRQWKTFDNEDHARAVAKKVRANLKRQGRDQTVTIAPSQEYLNNFAKEEKLVEGIKDTAGATAVIACLLTGGSLTGCATAPQKTSAQQVLKTGQDLGRTVQTAQRITRAGVESEVNQEIRNLLRGIGGRPEELNNSNILRIWRKIKGAPPVQPEPQAPEYGPADPVKRTPQYEAKEINTREDFVRERDRLLRMITQETNPANKQILRSAIRQLENRAENEGWIAIQQRMIREDNDSDAVEQAILKRIMVAHTDLLRQFGPQKVMQAAEEVAYNVGDLDEIGTSDVSGWVRQVEQILGARQ